MARDQRSARASLGAEALRADTFRAALAGRRVRYLTAPRSPFVCLFFLLSFPPFALFFAVEGMALGRRETEGNVLFGV